MIPSSSLLSYSAPSSLTSHASETVGAMCSLCFASSLSTMKTAATPLYPSDCYGIRSSKIGSSNSLYSYSQSKIKVLSQSEYTLVKLLETDFALLTSDFSQWISFLKKYTVKPIFLNPKLVDHYFPQIRCPRDTAIKVKGVFLHANQIKLGESSFIAMQDPWTPHLQELFWMMCIRVEQTNLIIDFAKKKQRDPESSLESDECGPTYPEEIGASVSFGATRSIRIECVNKMTEKIQDIAYTISTLFIHERVNEINYKKLIMRIHFSIWPESVPQSIYEMIGTIDYLMFILQTSKPSSMSKTEIPIVLCKSGVSKSGGLIACMALYESREYLNKDNLARVISHLILTGRQDRGTRFIATQQQLENIYKFGLSLI